MTESKRLNKRAASALNSGDYPLGETLYKAAVENIVGVLDPLHEDYVGMLKGLRVCLSKQHKVDEVQNVDQIISSLCLGQ